MFGEGLRAKADNFTSQISESVTSATDCIETRDHQHVQDDGSDIAALSDWDESRNTLE